MWPIVPKNEKMYWKHYIGVSGDVLRPLYKHSESCCISISVLGRDLVIRVRALNRLTTSVEKHKVWFLWCCFYGVVLYATYLPSLNICVKVGEKKKNVYFLKGFYWNTASISSIQQTRFDRVCSRDTRWSLIPFCPGISEYSVSNEIVWTLQSQRPRKFKINSA